MTGRRQGLFSPPEDWPLTCRDKKTSTANQLWRSGFLFIFEDQYNIWQSRNRHIKFPTEYLFSQKRFNEIAFHFTNGVSYDWASYCRGIRPVIQNRSGLQTFVQIALPQEKTHESLRNYLDIIYTYAGTVSLCKELKPANKLETGTVIIYRGCPGHCCLIVDMVVRNKKDTVYKLVEGCMPAQSIYVLANPYEPDLSPWYNLSKTNITTASFLFSRFYLRKFE
ncbi:MAG TPA: DUF4846 domain-containing protein [Puia sp.]|nr:DUF4846 domain-containing protein [Puia sp.]